MIIGAVQCFIKHWSHKQTESQYPNLISYLLFYDNSNK